MGRGRGKTKVEQNGVIRKLGMEHNQPIIRLPKNLKELGMYMSQEVLIVAIKGQNPMSWEIRIKPKQQSTEASLVSPQPQESS